MTRDDFARLQREQAVHDLYALAMHCRRRFIRSANLLEVRSATIEKLWEFGISAGVDPSPLFPAWKRLCDRYLSERYDPQTPLFGDHGAEEAKKWDQFIRWHLFPELLSSDELVRNVLRALGVLPCQSPEAAIAVGQHFAEMTLPSSRPAWAPDEVID